MAGLTLSMIAQITRLPRRQQPDALADCLEANGKQLLTLIAEWESKFGAVVPPEFPRGPAPHAESSQATRKPIDVALLQGPSCSKSAPNHPRRRDVFIHPTARNLTLGC